MLISALSAALCLAASAAAVVARGDDAFAPVAIGPRTGYIVSEEYAEAHKRELTESIPGPPKIEGFWTPTETNVLVAERIFREELDDAAKNPAVLFPDLGKPTDVATAELLLQAKDDLALIQLHYPAYKQQFMGLIIANTRLVYCNYADVPKIDPSAEYIYIQKTFDGNGSIHFLQAEVDPYTKTCSHVSYIGSWQGR